MSTPVIDETIPPAERSFRAAWFTNLKRTDANRPVLSADFVSRQGRAIRVIDIRSQVELTGELGHVPGSDWIPAEDARSLSAQVLPWDPLVIVSDDGTSAAQMAAHLEADGLKLVAAMEGGMRAWNEFGLSPSRSADLLQHRARLSPLPKYSAPKAGHLQTSEIQEHFGHPLSVRWIKLAALMTHGRMSCVDGRDHTGVVGCPGGDGGEFLLAISAVEQHRGRAVDDATLDALFRRRLDAFGRFAIHTDTHAGDRLISSIRADDRLEPFVAGITDPLAWRRFFFTPPEAARGLLLEHFVKPEHMGCGHLRLMAQHPERYGVRPGVVAVFQRMFLSRRWSGALELEVTPLPGGHAEGAVINVHLPGKLEAFSRVPYVSPSVAGRQMFVNHPDVAAYLRRQTAIWLCQQDDLIGLSEEDSSALFERMQTLHGAQLLATLKALAKGLPIFDITVRRDGTVDVNASGHVPE